jgi:hypothetical protein
MAKMPASALSGERGLNEFRRGTEMIVLKPSDSSMIIAITGVTSLGSKPSTVCA